MLVNLPTERLADVFASIVKASYPERLDILNAVSLEERFEKAFPLLLRQIDGLRLVQERQKNRVQETTKPKVSRVPFQHKKCKK
jgi:ATP-dependent Lon protease